MKQPITQKQRITLLAVLIALAVSVASVVAFWPAQAKAATNLLDNSVRNAAPNTIIHQRFNTNGNRIDRYIDTQLRVVCYDGPTGPMGCSKF